MTLLDIIIGFSIYLIVGVFYIRSFQLYIDHTFSYNLILCWIILPFYIFISDLINGDKIVRLRDKNNKPHRLIITKNTIFKDEREFKDEIEK
jgi:hypothetical protein